LFGLAVINSAYGAEYKLVWADEFNNGSQLNDCDWKFEMGGGGWGNNEQEFYTSHRKDNVRIENGNLVLNVKVEEYAGGQQHFTSGRIITAKTWTYGKFEAKAKLPKGKHLWPAIWMMPQNSLFGMWAASGEIDIMEYRGDNDSVIQGSIHYGGSWPNMQYSGSGEKDFKIDFSADFHIFALEWNTNDMIWSLDGKEYHREAINKMMWSGKGTNPYTKNGQPFDQPFFFVLNIAVSGNFFPADRFGPPVTPDEARKWTKPTMEVDYLRVYQMQ